MLKKLVLIVVLLNKEQNVTTKSNMNLNMFLEYF